MSLFRFALAADKRATLKRELGENSEAYFAAMETAEKAFLRSISNNSNQLKMEWLQQRIHLSCRTDERDLCRLAAYDIKQVQKVSAKFDGTARQVIEVTTDTLAAAINDIAAQPWLGFDTETAASFDKGRRNTNPIALIQIATMSHCYLFRMVEGNIIPFKQALESVLSSRSQAVKIGIGLRSDVAAMKRDFGIVLAPMLDLNWLMNQLGAPKQMGTVQIAAAVLGLKMPKSKRVTLSNWALPLTQPLSTEQREYAVADAFVALDCCYGLFEQILIYRQLWPSSLQQRFSEVVFDER